MRITWTKGLSLHRECTIFSVHFMHLVGNFILFLWDMVFQELFGY